MHCHLCPDHFQPICARDIIDLFDEICSKQSTLFVDHLLDVAQLQRGLAGIKLCLQELGNHLRLLGDI